MWRAAFGVLLSMAMVAGCASTPPRVRYAEATSPDTRHCMMSGSRIVSREGDCFAAGRSYPLDILHRNHTAAGTLRDLDPSITIKQ